MQREIGCLGAEFGYEDASIQLIDGQGRLVPPRRVMTAKGGRVPAFALAAVQDGTVPGHAFLRGVLIGRELELPIPDLPLVVESLLLRAVQLTGSGAPPEPIKAILDHGNALREGRG